MQNSGWTKSKLQDLCTIEYGKAPSEVRVEFSEYPLYGTSGITGYANRPLFKAPLIMVGRKGTINKPLFIENDCWIIDTAYGLITDKVDLKWLFYFISNYDLSRLNEATGVPSLNRSNLYNIEVLVPPMNEQHKIADIFTSVDNAISKTEAIIEQTEKVKKGLMQQLLTKGIGHTKFKQTEIGKLPVEWAVKRASEIANVEYGISEAVSSNKDSSIGIPILTGANITLEGSLDLSKIVYIDKRNNPRFELKKGDLLFNWRSGSQSHVGKTAIFNLEGDYTYASFILRIRLFEENNNRFYYYLLNHLKETGYFTKDTSIQVNFKLNAATFRELLLPCPSLNEQVMIADIMDSITNKKSAEQLKLSQLQLLKKSLMQILLTGKVRVKVDDQEVVTT